jgi:acylphosphatase
MPDENLTLHVFVNGRVQGVGYRDWTCRTAQRLRLDGWVRNRSDGRVEAVFSGPAETVKAMVTRCRTGPGSARVSSVDAKPAEPVEAGFRVLPTV